MKKDRQHDATRADETTTEELDGSAEPRAEELIPEVEGTLDEVGPLPEDRDDVEAIQDRHLRLAAEFDNYRKRTQRELRDARQAAKAALAADLLDVLDDLGRVADLEPETTTVEALDEGVEMVERKLHKALADSGLMRIDPQGEPFDPNVHEALMMAPTDDPERDGLVGQVLMVGYRFGDRLLRPARVSVLQYDPDRS